VQAPEQRCELCAAAVGSEHAHVVDLSNRGIRCACRPCWLLFTWDGAGGRRYLAVPERHRYDPEFTLTEAQWDELQIPVAMAFLFHSSAAGRTVAFYPSPAGAIESLLPLSMWDDVLRANPGAAGLAPDVEALLLRRQHDRFEAYLVPIDTCYRLVGLVRTTWRGFDGGEQARQAIEDFFADLRRAAAAAR
jgi:hypothetical protein